MPDSSPTFAIPYPCVGEPITLATFSSFATAVEAAIASVDAVEDFVLSRPSAFVVNSGSTSVPLNVSTPLTYDTELWDTDGMGNLGANNERLTIQTNGVYMIFGGTNSTAAPATLTSNAVILTKNGTTFAENKQDSTSNTFPTHATSIIPCISGDIIRCNYLWTGTVGPINIGGRLGARLLVRT